MSGGRIVCVFQRELQVLRAPAPAGWKPLVFPPDPFVNYCGVLTTLAAAVAAQF